MVLVYRLRYKVNSNWAFGSVRRRLFYEYMRDFTLAREVFSGVSLCDYFSKFHWTR